MRLRSEFTCSNQSYSDIGARSNRVGVGAGKVSACSWAEKNLEMEHCRETVSCYLDSGVPKRTIRLRIPSTSRLVKRL